jgi:hypothetical protein
MPFCAFKVAHQKVVMGIASEYGSYYALVFSREKQAERKNPLQERIDDAVNSPANQITAKHRIYGANTLHRNRDLLEVDATLQPSPKY